MKIQEYLQLQYDQSRWQLLHCNKSSKSLKNSFILQAEKKKQHRNWKINNVLFKLLEKLFNQKHWNSFLPLMALIGGQVHFSPTFLYSWLSKKNFQFSVVQHKSLNLPWTWIVFFHLMLTMYLLYKPNTTLTVQTSSHLVWSKEFLSWYFER